MSEIARPPAIRTLASLRRHLQWAVELEHLTIPPYLCGFYTIRDGANAEAAALIKSVVLEEMLHMALAANVLNAVGGAPAIDRPGFVPRYPTYLPHSNQALLVPLQRFGHDAIRTFMHIEQPEEKDAPPEAHGYATIAQFYHAIREGLHYLCDELGERAVFTGSPDRQLDGSYFYGAGGELHAVADRTSADRAFDVIVEQGEGADEGLFDKVFNDGEEEPAHYYKFDEIRQGRRYVKGDTPESGPTGDCFEVDWEAVHPMRDDPRAADYAPGTERRRLMDSFNRAYTHLLQVLHHAFNGEQERMNEATAKMYELRYRAVELLNVPSGRDDGTVMGPSFEYCR